MWELRCIYLHCEPSALLRNLHVSATVGGQASMIKHFIRGLMLCCEFTVAIGQDAVTEL